MKKGKILSLIIAIVMIMAAVLPTTAFAAVKEGSITIKKPANISIDGQTFYAYKIFDVEVIKTAGQDDSYIYSLAENFADLDELYETLSALNADTDAAKVRIEADKIWAFIEDDGEIEPDGSVTAVGKDVQSVTIDDLDPGYYLVFGKGTAKGDVTVTAACSLTNATPSVEITPKMDAPSIDKTVQYHVNDNWQDWTDVNINDSVTFKHESKVPEMDGYDKYRFIVHDTMSAGLTLDVNSQNSTGYNFTIKIGDDNVTDKCRVVVGDVAADVEEKYEDGTEITIYFPDLTQYTPGAKIVITYTATLNENAIIGVEGNPNKVKLEYSTNPYNTGTGDPTNPDDEDDPYTPGETDETPEDEVIVYTFALDVYKYTGNLAAGKDIALEGVKFELYAYTTDDLEDYEDATPIEFVIDTKTGNYRVATAAEIADGDIKKFTELTSDANGKIHADGLDTGTYALVETETIGKYNMLDKPVKVEIVFDRSDLENLAFSYTVDDTNTLQDTVNVLNNSGTQLPGTGGIGTKIFYGAGILLTIGLVVLLVIRRRMKALEA